MKQNTGCSGNDLPYFIALFRHSVSGLATVRFRTPYFPTASQFYHVYNRGNNDEKLFREERNYGYFLQLYRRYLCPVADTYAYCLLDNHFHLLVRMKIDAEIAHQDYTPSKGGQSLYCQQSTMPII